MVLDKDSVTHHDVAEGSNGHWNQPVPICEKVKEGEVDQARDGRAEYAPGRLEEGGVQARDNVDDAIADDQAVDPCSLFPQDAEPGPEVDCKGEQGDQNVCKKINSCLCLIHLDCHCKSALQIVYSPKCDLTPAAVQEENQGCRIVSSSQNHDPNITRYHCPVKRHLIGDSKSTTFPAPW